MLQRKQLEKPARKPLNRGFDSVRETKFGGMAKQMKDTADIYAEVAKELHKQGVDLFTGDDIASEYLTLPALLTEESSKELGNYFNTFTKQKMWVRTLQGETRAVLRDIEQDLDEIRATVYAPLPVKMSAKDKELKLFELPTAVALMKNYEHYKTKLDMLNGYIASIEDAIVNVSREITRRENDVFAERRDNNMGRR